MSAIEKIFLAKMTKIGVNVSRDRQVIVDDESDVGVPRDRKENSREAPDFFDRSSFRAQLDQVSAAVAQLLRDQRRFAAVKIGSVHERI